MSKAAKKRDDLLNEIYGDDNSIYEDVEDYMDYVSRVIDDFENGKEDKYLSRLEKYQLAKTLRLSIDFNDFVFLFLLFSYVPDHGQLFLLPAQRVRHALIDQIQSEQRSQPSEAYQRSQNIRDNPEQEQLHPLFGMEAHKLVIRSQKVGNREQHAQIADGSEGFVALAGLAALGMGSVILPKALVAPAGFGFRPLFGLTPFVFLLGPAAVSLLLFFSGRFPCSRFFPAPLLLLRPLAVLLSGAAALFFQACAHLGIAVGLSGCRAAATASCRALRFRFFLFLFRIIAAGKAARLSVRNIGSAF